MTEEHPFAQYIRIIGKGPHLSRPLTEEEAYDATSLILQGKVEPLQLGAFLCILRIRTEEPEEGAGFIRAVRDHLEVPDHIPAIDLDWPSYSGKKRQPPWYVLAALALANSGVKIFMHGGEGHTPGRVYTSEALSFLGLSPAQDLAEAARHIEERNLSYVTLDKISPVLQDIISLKPILGLRSPVNTFARMINPFGAPAIIQSIFHPAYKEVHRETAKALGTPRMMVFKGEGGEVEYRPQKPLAIEALVNGEMIDTEWPSTLAPEVSSAHVENIDLSVLKELWRDDSASGYGKAAVMGTIALALQAMGRAEGQSSAHELAYHIWQHRDLNALS